MLDYISPFIGIMLQSWDSKINNVAGRFILEMTSETHPKEMDVFSGHQIVLHINVS